MWVSNSAGVMRGKGVGIKEEKKRDEEMCEERNKESWRIIYG